jgi:hypothetical protein
MWIQRIYRTRYQTPAKGQHYVADRIDGYYGA